MLDEREQSYRLSVCARCHPVGFAYGHYDVVYCRPEDFASERGCPLCDRPRDEAPEDADDEQFEEDGEPE